MLTATRPFRKASAKNFKSDVDHIKTCNVLFLVVYFFLLPTACSRLGLRLDAVYATL